MTLRYGSVCSGIEAATTAWHQLGWQPQFFSEIEAAPRAVLSHRHPEVPLHGDFTTIRSGEYGAIELLVGGTPCQSFSVAGLRGGLADDRGNLALQYLRLAERLCPRWLVWENVPGVLSSNGGRDFGAILGGMVELGYGFAYRVLDAQYVRVDGFGRAVPQRRRRVFVVGYLGDWRRPAAVLLERACLRGDPSPSRSEGSKLADSPAYGIDRDCLDRSGEGSGGTAAERSGLGIEAGIAQTLKAKGPGAVAAAVAPAISASNPYGDHESREGLLVAHSLRGEGFDASEDGTGRGTPIIPVASTLLGGGHSTNPMEETLIPFQQGGSNIGSTGRITGTLPAGNGNESGGVPCIAFQANESCAGHFSGEMELSPTLKSGHGGGSTIPAVAMPYTLAIRGRDDGHQLEYRQDGTANAILTPNGGRAGIGVGAIAQGWAVRRLTPTECERLQGFADGYTAVPWRGGIMPDGPRYKMLGNSMAVNAMRWIGRRIEAVEAIASLRDLEAA